MHNVAEWLEGLGLGEYAEAFADNRVDADVLPHLTNDDLKDIGVMAVGDRRRLLDAIAALSTQDVKQAEEAVEEATPSDKRKREVEAERRQLTVMFCDLVGSTELSGRLDPEDLQDVIRGYQDTVTAIIGEFDGFVARYMGDGLLVYFGYPQAHEDDAERAIRAGLGIVEAVGGLRPRGDLTLQVRIGIATGLVVVGDHIGEGASEEKAVVGETPNLAARLQSLAEPNTVVIAPATHHLVSGLFEHKDLGSHDLKGISTPVQAWRVVGETAAESRFDAAHAAGITPLVGREEEIGLLLKRWDQAKDGDGQVVLLSGEAGVGKSRILRSFRERLEDELRNRVLYYCSPYHQNSAFYPAIDQLERSLRFEKDDGAGEKLDKLEAVLGELGLPVPEIAPLLASLLSLPAGDRYPPPPLGAEEMKKKILEALVAVFEAMASRDPVLMVIEDVHWIDPSTLELLGLLIEHLRSARVVLVIAYRPEFDSPWGGHAHVTGLTLNRLSRKESAAMIARVAGGKALPEEVLGEIVAKTDGVPLFVEELTKTVLESDLLDDAGDRYVLSGPLPPLAIPASLQNSLMARLDRLASVKEVAQLAAALGRRFSHELLAAVSLLGGAALDDALDKLVESQLVYRRGTPPEASYEFKHALVQDTAYESLLRSRRRQLHARIAEVLEDRFPERAEGEPELLAHHYTEAGLAEHAIPYWRRAGQRAAERSAYPESIAHLYKGLELLMGLPDSPERDRSELGLRITLGPALMSFKGMGMEEVEQTYTRARKLAEGTGDSVSLFTALYGLWQMNHVRGAVAVAKGIAGDLMRSTEGGDDSGQRLQAHHSNWTSSFFSGDPKACLHHTSRGVEIYDREEHRTHRFLYGAHDPGVCGLTLGSVSSWFLGYPDRGVQMGEDSMALAEELAHPVSAAVGLLFVTAMYQFRRDAEATERYGEMGVALCAEHGIAAWGPAMATLRGWAQLELGGGDAVAEIGAAMQTWQATGNKLFWPWFLALQAEADGQAGKAQDGLEKAAEGLAHAERTGEHWVDAELHRTRGDLLLARSARNIKKAETAFLEALEVARGQEAKSLELRATTSLARLWGENKKRAEAHALLAPIYGWFTEGFDTPDLKDAKALLDELN